MCIAEVVLDEVPGVQERHHHRHPVFVSPLVGNQRPVRVHTPVVYVRFVRCALRLDFVLVA